MPVQAWTIMGLYNRGEHAEETAILLWNVADTSTDAWIGRYRRAIGFYADKLDQTW